VGLHVVVLAALVLSVRLPPQPPEPPPVQVSLIDLPPTDPIMQPLRPIPPPLRPRPAAEAPIDAPPPPQQLRGAVERGPNLPAPDNPERGERPPNLSFYKDNLKGCEKEALMLMPAAEQEKCRARITAAALAAPRNFRRDAPPIEALSGLSAARRAALEAEALRRARAGAPMGQPVGLCEGRLNNLNAGCLPGQSND
jgi:hypothetical protein